MTADPGQRTAALTSSPVARQSVASGDGAVKSSRGWWLGLAAILIVVLGVAVMVFGFSTPVASRPVNKLAAMLRQGTWIDGCIPAPRGCILDKNGLPLAWSTRQFAVNWIVPGQTADAHEEFAILARYLGGNLLLAEADLGQRVGQSVTLKRDLGPKDVAAVARLQAEVIGLTITSCTVRHQAVDKTIQPRLGEVQTINGREVGISGEEKEHDAMLTGRDGRFRVMVDNEGRWLKNSWQKVLDIRPGYDVYLSAAAEPAVLASSGR